MINLDAIARLAPEQIAAMSTEQRLALDAGLALLSIHLNANFLSVALESGKLSRDDQTTLLATKNILKEMLQKAFPNRKW